MKTRLKNTYDYICQHMFLLYTVLFIITACVIFSTFLINGISFISNGDGTNQHVKALVYYSEYLRQFIHSILSGHPLSFPEWEHSIGEGGDILSTLHYYVIGDPLTLISVFFNRENIYFCYDIIQLIRLYLAGLAFLLLCRETIPDCTSVRAVSGAMLYCFSSWAMRWTIDHPYFLTPLIYLPLMVLGVERILKKKSIIVLSLSVMFCSLSNFYFFYMCGLMIAGYVILRLLFLYFPRLQNALIPLLKISLAAVWGIAMSAVILLPQLYSFIGNPRVGLNSAMRLTADLGFWGGMPAQFFSPGNYWSMAAIVFPAIVLLFCLPKQHRLLKLLLLLVPVMLGFKIFGSIFNGFSHSLDRWTFAVALLFSYIFTAMWDELISNLRSKIRPVMISSLIYCILCMLLELSRSREVFISFCITLFYIFFVTRENISSAKKENITLITVFCILVINGIIMYSFDEGNYASYTRPVNDLSETLYDNESLAITAASQQDPEYDGGFFRYSGDLSLNSGFLHSLSSTAFYWSTVTPWGQNFRSNIALLNNDVYTYFDYDKRTIADAIAGIRYFIANDERVPYGYSFLGSYNISERLQNKRLASLMTELGTDTLSEEQINSICRDTDNYEYVFKNDYALPVGFTYDSYISYEDYLKLAPPEREWVMLDAAVLSEVPENVNGLNRVYGLTKNTRLPLDFHEPEGHLYINGSDYTVSDSGSLTFDFDSPANSETYCYLSGIDYSEIDEYDLYLGEDDKYDPSHLYNKTNFSLLSATERLKIIKDHFLSDPANTTGIKIILPSGEKKSITYYTPYKKSYGNRHDFVVNLGYNEESPDSLSLVITSAGQYKIDNIAVYSMPMAEYPAKIAKLKEDVLENEVWASDSLSGTIDLERPKLLYFSIPYSKGWEAVVDDTPTTLICANDMYMALYLPAGKHQINLHYKTPYLRMGFVITLISLILFIVWSVVYLMRKNRKKETH